MAEIMNILRADHRTMARLLDNLESQIAPLCGEAVPNYELLNEAVNYCLTYGSTSDEMIELTTKTMISSGPELV